MLAPVAIAAVDYLRSADSPTPNDAIEILRQPSEQVRPLAKLVGASSADHATWIMSRCAFGASRMFCQLQAGN